MTAANKQSAVATVKHRLPTIFLATSGLIIFGLLIDGAQELAPAKFSVRAKISAHHWNRYGKGFWVNCSHHIDWPSFANDRGKGVVVGYNESAIKGENDSPFRKKYYGVWQIWWFKDGESFYGFDAKQYPWDVVLRNTWRKRIDWSKSFEGNVYFKSADWSSSGNYTCLILADTQVVPRFRASDTESIRVYEMPRGKPLLQRLDPRDGRQLARGWAEEQKLIPYHDGDQVILRCRVNAARPTPSLIWYLNERPLSHTPGLTSYWPSMEVPGCGLGCRYLPATDGLTVDHDIYMTPIEYTNYPNGSSSAQSQLSVSHAYLSYMAKKQANIKCRAAARMTRVDGIGNSSHLVENILWTIASAINIEYVPPESQDEFETTFITAASDATRLSTWLAVICLLIAV